MPWTIRSPLAEFAEHPQKCPACFGYPGSAGSSQCSTCGAILVADDPPPGEVAILKLVPVDDQRRPLPRRLRRSIEVRWGERRQADGTMAKVYRVINKANVRYVERTVRQDGKIIECDEPLAAHRGHGSARQST
jgi:hypothetical protein